MCLPVDDAYYVFQNPPSSLLVRLKRFKQRARVQLRLNLVAAFKGNVALKFLEDRPV